MCFTAVALALSTSQVEAKTVAGVSVLVRPVRVPPDNARPVSLTISRSFTFDPMARYLSDAVLLDPAFTVELRAVPACEAPILGMSSEAALAACRASLIGHETVGFADGTSLKMDVFNQRHGRYLAYGVRTQDGVEVHYRAYGSTGGGPRASIGVNLPVDDSGSVLPAGSSAPASVAEVRVKLTGTARISGRRETIVSASCPRRHWKLVISRQVPATVNGVATNRWVRAGALHISCASSTSSSALKSGADKSDPDLHP